MLTQSGAPGCVIGWTDFSHQHSIHGFHQNFQHCTGFVHYLFCFVLLILMGAELPLCIVVILECYNLFSGVKLSIKSFCFIYSS